MFKKCILILYQCSFRYAKECHYSLDSPDISSDMKDGVSSVQCSLCSRNPKQLILNHFKFCPTFTEM